jgi:hypothetical protein
MATALELYWLPGVPHSGNAAEQPDLAQDDREGRDAGSPHGAGPAEYAEPPVPMKYV